MGDIISAQKVVFGYPKEDNELNIVLRGVSLTIPEGQLVAVLGHNGSGKSTLAKHFNAILVPNEGVVEVCGIDTKDEDRLYDIRQTVGMVFQNPDNQIVATIVEEDVAFGPENMGVEPKEIRLRVDGALADVGMSEYKTHAPHQLSGGQKQRVAIAGVLAMQPACLVLDEATAMLDPIGRQQVLRTVHSLNREKGITVVQITHYMEEAAMAGRVVVMSAGRVVMDGTPREVFTRADELHALHLDVPQPAELCRLLDGGGIHLPPDIIGVDECAAALYRLLTGKEAPAHA